MAESTVSLLRVCTKCLIAKPADLDAFPPHKMGRFGLHSLCRSCKKVCDAALRSRPDQRARQKAWRDANKAWIRDYNEKYRENYTSTADVASWRVRNLDHARQYAREKAREKRATKPWYVLKQRVSVRLSAMLRGKNGRRTEELLGYTRQQLIDHIERQFTKGMSWEALRGGKIHIDHIVPVSSFRITGYDDPEFRACWALTNLRPLWAKDNLSKGCKRLTLL